MKIPVGLGVRERAHSWPYTKVLQTKEAGKEGCNPASPPTPSLAFVAVGADDSPLIEES